MIGSTFLEPLMENFVMHAVGAMVVGVCCGSTSYVYKIESLSLRKQIAFHFTIGLGGYLLIAYKFGRVFIFIIEMKLKNIMLR